MRRLFLVPLLVGVSFPVLADDNDADPFEATSAPILSETGPVVTSWPYEEPKPTVVAGAPEEE